MFYDLLRIRRSIRKYQPVEIEAEKLEALKKSALLTPSSRGRRSWEFIFVTDRETLQKLSRCREGASGFLAGAALGIVVLGDREQSDVWTEDASIAAMTLQLAAHSLGLGSCWIQVRNRDHSEDVKAGEYIGEALGIPERFGVECILAVGYPAEEKKPYDEAGLNYEKVHKNRYGG